MGLDLVDEDPGLARRAKERGFNSINLSDDFETAFFKLLLDAVEPGIARLGAVVLYDYPASQAALAKIEKGVAKRFEFYISGIELCNAF